MRARLSMRDEQEAAGRAEAGRLVQRVLENLGEMMPVHLAGEAIEARKECQPLLELVAFVDDAHHAVRPHRPGVGTGEPAAGVLDPQPGFGSRIGADAILDLIGDAVAVVARLRIHHHVEARLRVLGLQELRVGAAGRDGVEVADQQHVGGVGAPHKLIAVDAPVVGNLADGSKNPGGVERLARGLGTQCCTIGGFVRRTAADRRFAAKLWGRP